ncbi:Protein of unknown function [Bacillus mycoides]|nr:Protein of unknown function [Bacillus mycoides]
MFLVGKIATVHEIISNITLIIST